MQLTLALYFFSLLLEPYIKAICTEIADSLPPNLELPNLVASNIEYFMLNLSSMEHRLEQAKLSQTEGEQDAGDAEKQRRINIAKLVSACVVCVCAFLECRLRQRRLTLPLWTACCTCRTIAFIRTMEQKGKMKKRKTTMTTTSLRTADVDSKRHIPWRSPQTHKDTG